MVFNEHTFFIKSRQTIFQKQKLDSLVSAINNPKSFWSKLKHMTYKRSATTNTVTTEQWVGHFTKLLNTDSENANHDEHLLIDEPSDETEQYIFNSEILDHEVTNAVKN